MLRYPANSPQNLRPSFAQQPGNGRFMPTMMPQYRPFIPQPLLGATLGRLILDNSRSQVENMMKRRSMQQMHLGALQGAQGDMGMVNDIGELGNCTNGASYNTGTFGDGQFGTDGGLGSGGVDLGRFGNGGLDMGMLGNNNGLDFGGLGGGGIHFSSFSM